MIKSAMNVQQQVNTKQSLCAYLSKYQGGKKNIYISNITELHKKNTYRKS